MLNILSKNPGQATLNIYSSMGQRLVSMPLNNLMGSIPVQALSKGVYILVIEKADKTKAVSKIIVY